VVRWPLASRSAAVVGATALRHPGGANRLARVQGGVANCYVPVFIATRTAFRMAIRAAHHRRLRDLRRAVVRKILAGEARAEVKNRGRAAAHRPQRVTARGSAPTRDWKAASSTANGDVSVRSRPRADIVVYGPARFNLPGRPLTGG